MSEVIRIIKDTTGATRIVALDPGGTTGVCILDLYPEEEDPSYEIRQEELSEDDHHLTLWDSLMSLNPDAVVCESFTWRPNLTRHHVVLMSKEYIGVAKLWCQAFGVEYTEQMPSHAKNFWDDYKVKTVGLWVPGMPHAMDATRHALYYVMQQLDDKRFLYKFKENR